MQPDLLIPAKSRGPSICSVRAPGFVVRLLDNHLVVLDTFRQELRVLNPAASALWLMLDEGWQSLDELQSLLGAGAGAGAGGGGGGGGQGEGMDSVARTLAEWRAIGWLETAGHLQRLSPARIAEQDPARQRARVYPQETPLPPHETLVRLIVMLGGRYCALHLGQIGRGRYPETLARLRAVVAGLTRDTADTPDECLRLELVDAGDGFWVRIPGMTAFTRDESFALASIIKALVLP